MAKELSKKELNALQNKSKKINVLSVFMGVLFLGSLWGILEATMGNILHWIGFFPGTGMLMTSIAIGIMTFGRKLYHVKGIGIFMGIIAAGIKSLDFLVPGSNVVRPMVAIIITACAYEAIMYVAEKVKESLVVETIAGVITGYVSITVFAYFTAYVMQFNYWLSKGALGILKFIGTDEWMFGPGAGIMVLLGTFAIHISDNLLSIRNFVKTRAFYGISCVFAAICITVAFFV